MEYPQGVELVPADRSGGSKVAAAGGARAVCHSTEGDSIEGAVAAYRKHGGWPHLTWDPQNGRIAGHLPASSSARSVENRSGGVETNRYGTVLQIEVVARAARPFTDGPLVGLDRILAYTRANGVPDDWPMGQPLAYGPDERRPGVTPAAYGTQNGTRDAGVWLTRGGWYGHSQVPENDHGDPGRIDTQKITGSSAGPTPIEEDSTVRIVAVTDGKFQGLNYLIDTYTLPDGTRDAGIVKVSPDRGVAPFFVAPSMEALRASGVPYKALPQSEAGGLRTAPPDAIHGAVVDVAALAVALEPVVARVVDAQSSWIRRLFPKKAERAVF